MRLTAFTDYALRVLIYAALDPDRRVTIRDVAGAYGISRNHLMKVVNKLTRAGLVTSTRGASGGFVLARAPDEITVGEVFRATEDDTALVECFRVDNKCPITPECELKHLLGDALAAFLAVLDSRTVADIISADEPLRRRLGMTAPPADPRPARVSD